MCLDQRRATAMSATLWLLVGGLLTLYVIVFALTALSRLLRPLDEVTYGESWLLDGARLVATGQGLYSAPDHLPLMHIAYTPLYYALVGGLQRLVGDHGYTPGRVLSLAAVLIGTAALCLSVRHLTGRSSMGLLAGGLFLTQNVTLVLWGPLHRVDSLALGLTLVGLALATTGRPVLAAALFVAAVLTKQTFFVAPLAVAVGLWPGRSQVVRFVAVWCGGAVLLFAALTWLTQGWFVWHTVTANGNGPDFPTFSTLVGHFVQFNGVPLLACLASFALPSRSTERIWRLYLMGALATLIGLTKLGASSNYWLEVSAAIAVCLALAADRLSHLPAARLVAPAVIGGALLSSLPAYQATATAALLNLADAISPGQTRYVSLVGDGDATSVLRIPTSLIERLANEPGELLTDNSGLAVAARKPIVFEFQIFQLLDAQGLWSDRPIVDAIMARRFSLVVLMHPLSGPLGSTRWTAREQRALLDAYTIIGHESGLWLYRPRLRPT